MTERCICASLPDLAHIAMGDSDQRDEEFLATVEEVQQAGGEQWWLYLGKCKICAQDWLVAQDDRIYDEHFLKRLKPAEAARITANGTWPDTFITYERVLRVGNSLARPCRFFDPMDSSLVWSVRDLQKDRPDIPVREIGHLLGVSDEHAVKLMAASAPGVAKRLQVPVWAKLAHSIGKLFGQK